MSFKNFKSKNNSEIKHIYMTIMSDRG